MKGAQPITAGSQSYVTSTEVGIDVTTAMSNILAEGGSAVEWLVRHEQEGRHDRVPFYSTEGALEAGDLEKSPRLVLQFQ